MNSVKKVTLAVCTVMAISVFLPWVEVSSSVNLSVPGYGSYNNSYSTGGISGISTGYGIFGLLLSIGALIMILRDIKVAWILGIVALLDSLGLAFGWFSAKSSYSGSGFSGHAGISVQFGLILFIICSILLIILSSQIKPISADTN